MVDAAPSAGAFGDSTPPAGPGGPQLAQAADVGALGEPIGLVLEITGEVLLLHADGTSEVASANMPVFVDDLVTTGPGGAVEIVFVDGTTFSLGANGQMRLDNLVFDPAGNDNGLDATVVKGSFVFITGQIGKEEGEGVQIDTPAGTIGIRGTSGAGAQDPVTGAWIFTLFRDPDGTLSRFTIANPAGAQLLDQEFESTQIAGQFIRPSQTFVLSSEEAAVLFSSALELLQEQFPQLQSPERRGELNDIAPAAGEQFALTFGIPLPTAESLGDLYGLDLLAQALADLLAAGGVGETELGGGAGSIGASSADTFLPVASDSQLAPPIDVDQRPNIIPENLQAGDVVFVQAQANDPRFTGPVIYSILGNPGAFAIDRDTGVVTVANPSLLNFENGSTITIVVQASDGIRTSVAPLTITLTDVNERPTAIQLSNAVVAENSPGAVIGTLTAVDPDKDDSATFTVSDQRFEVVNGQLQLKDGVSLDHESSDKISVTVTATDSGGLSTTQVFEIEVTNVNDPPIADADKTVEVTEDSADTALNIAAPSDADGDSLTITVTDVPNAEIGTVYLADGLTPVSAGMMLTAEQLTGLVFRPEPNANGLAGTFSYSVEDGQGGTATQTVTLAVDAVNDPPAADADKTVEVAEDAANTPLNIAAPTDVDGDALTITVTAVPGAAIGTVYLADGVTPVSVGMILTAAELAGLLFRPVPDANGLATFSYSVSDGHDGADSQTITFNVTPENDPPVADTDKIVTVDEDSGDTPLAIAAPTDIDGDSLTITVTAVPNPVVGAVYLADGTTLVTSGMQLTAAQLTGLVFRPAADANGAAGTFSYSVTDGNGGSDSQTIALNVTPENDPPVVGGDKTVDVAEDSGDTPLAITAPVDVDGDELTITVSTVPNGEFGVVFLADGQTPVTVGMVLTAEQLTGLLFRPAPNANGAAGSFSYMVDDGQGRTATQTVALTVGAVNDPPIADADKTVEVAEDSANTALDIAAPTDVDDDALTITVTAVPDAEVGSIYLAGGVTAVSVGMILTAAELTGLLFRPVTDAHGAAGAFSYSVTDGNGGSDSQTVTLSVTPENDSPVADADKTVEVTEDSASTPLNIAAPTDVDGDELTITVNAVPSGDIGRVYLADGQTLVTVGFVLTTEQLTGLLFRPEPNANGPAGSFSYSVEDGQGGTATQTVTLTVNAVNDAPAADPDKTVDVAEDAANTPLNIAAPTDVDGDALAITVTAVPVAAIGAVYLADGVTPVSVGMILTAAELTGLLFRPAADANGTATFSYSVSDGNDSTDSTDSQTITLNVTPENDPPVADANKIVTVDEDSGDTALNIAAPTDIDGDTLTITVTAVPDAAIGTVYLADGVTSVSAGTVLTSVELTSLLFRPAADTNGAAGTFGYSVTDGNGGSDSQTIALNVTPVNDPPVVAADKTVTVDEDSGSTALAIAAPTDIDGGDLVITVTAVPDSAIGSVYLADGTTIVSDSTVLTVDQLTGLLFRPEPNANGAAGSFSYSVSDGNGGSNSQTVMLNVTPVNDPPLAAGDAYKAAEDEPLVVATALGVLANDTDIDDDELTPLLVEGPAHGKLTLNPDGSFAYTPDADYHGPDSFTYQASDGVATSDAVTVTIDVKSVNDAPDAGDDGPFTTGENEPVVISIAELLANDTDTDVDGDKLVLTNVEPLTGGSVIIEGGNIIFQPDQGVDGEAKFTYTVSDGHGGTDTAVVTVDVVDSAPTATPDSAATADRTTQTINLVIIFDRSGSMGNSPGVPGFSTRQELANAAIAALFEAYGSIATINIQIVDFAGTAAQSGWLTTAEAANAYLAGLTPSGGTNYAAAIQTAMSAYASAPPADQAEIYFLSDGEPTAGQSLAAAGLVDDWEAFLSNPANNIDRAFAVGIGGIQPGDPDLADVAFPNNDPSTLLVVTDEGQLVDTLVGTVANTVSGNVLDNDSFGADGPGNGGFGLLSITVDGVTYTFDGTEIVNDAQLPPIAGAKLVVITGLGGTLEFHFDGGDYSYAPPDVTQPTSEEFTYVIVDGDGSMADATLQIDITDSGIVTRDPSTFVGTDKADTLLGGTLDDIMSGGNGNDTISGNAGNDRIQGGAGDDSLSGGAGVDIVIGGAGNDAIRLVDIANFAAIEGGGIDKIDLSTGPGDRLLFDGTLDLTTAAGDRIGGIETLSMADGAGGDKLIVTAADIIGLGTGHLDPPISFGSFGKLDDASAIRVDGDSGDTLVLADAGWVKVTGTAPVVAGYDLYVHDAPGGAVAEDAYLLVQTAITVTTG